MRYDLAAGKWGMYADPSEKGGGGGSGSGVAGAGKSYHGMARVTAAAATVQGDAPLNPSAIPWISSSGKSPRGVGGSGPGASTSVGAGTTGAGANFKMPTWKMQTPIEVFEDNEIDTTSGGLKNPNGMKHRYHVGDKKRRTSMDAAAASSAATGVAHGGGVASAVSGLFGGASGGFPTSPGSPARKVFSGLTSFGGGSARSPSPLGVAPVALHLQEPTAAARLRRTTSEELPPAASVSGTPAAKAPTPPISPTPSRRRRLSRVVSVAGFGGAQAAH